MPVLTYGSEKEISGIRVVHMNNLRSLLGIRRMDRPKSMDKAVVQ